LKEWLHAEEEITIWEGRELAPISHRAGARGSAHAQIRHSFGDWGESLACRAAIA
jgi:hypothetical protein